MTCGVKSLADDIYFISQDEMQRWNNLKLKYAYAVELN